jgi:hypothetical protein
MTGLEFLGNTMNKIRVYSPRIHNLGDFIHCLPVLSGLAKKLDSQISFGICNRLERFKGIKELLMAQGFFSNVNFMYELYTTDNNYILLEDTGTEEGYGTRPIVTHKMYTFIRDNYKIDFECDDDFELKLQDVLVEDTGDKFVIGDRWSPKDAVDVDTRRYSNLIESANIIPKENAIYLDYTKDLMYNCNLVKKSAKPFISTFTGIGILADLMKKETHVLWDEDMRNWQGKPVEHDFDLHYYKNRNSKLFYIHDYQY